jgi:hypothetical protein
MEAVTTCGRQGYGRGCSIWAPRLLHQDLRAHHLPSLAELDPQLPNPIAQRTPLGRPWRDFDQALDQRIANAAITA